MMKVLLIVLGLVEEENIGFLIMKNGFSWDCFVNWDFELKIFFLIEFNIINMFVLILRNGRK